MALEHDCNLVALAALALALGSTAHAQAGAGYPIEIRGHEPGFSFTLRKGPQALPIVEGCADPCALSLHGGRVRLEVLDEAGEEAGTRDLRVDRAALWTVTPADPVERYLGLGMVLGGIALVTAGSLLIVKNADLDFGVGHSSVPEDSDDSNDSLAGLGVVSLLTGAVIAPIGVVMFFKNLRTRVRIQAEGATLRGTSAPPALALDLQLTL